MKHLNCLVAIISLIACSILFVSGEKIPQKTLFENFEKAMEGVRFSGFFTVDGSKNPPSSEVYEIQSVQKFGDKDLWIFTARIKYGQKDVTLPMPLPVKWVDNIPESVFLAERITAPAPSPKITETALPLGVLSRAPE